ncbi:hypothetical protein BDQ17DRAFT_1344636 [Cyathus striatus]|nr:hypothetical protein BDQ17DRAFT_1344636 [Cyathus striatus]
MDRYASPVLSEHTISQDKGKRRAIVSPPTNEYNPNGTYFPIRKLTTIFLTTLTFTLIFFIALALLAWSYVARAEHIDPNEILNNHITFRGPDRNAGMWLRVQGRLGVDAASAIGDIWKSIGRWGVRRLDTVSVRLSSISVTAADDPTTVLAHLEMPSMRVPLSTDKGDAFGEEWLTKVQFPVFISPTKNTTALLHFLRESWRLGYVIVRAEVEEVTVRPGSVHTVDYVGWKGKFMKQLRNVRTGVKIKSMETQSPSLPSSLITLLNFSVSTSNSTITLDATAKAKNFIPPTVNASFTVPTTALPIASVHTLPLPLPPATDPPTDLLSTSPLPRTQPKPKLLRDRVGRCMPRLCFPWGRGGGGCVESFADVLVFDGEVPDDAITYPSVPSPAAAVVPTLTSWKKKHAPPPSQPLPSPLPERAFGHIRPEDWLPSISEPVELEDEEGAKAYVVTAQVVDVPLEVLPGRNKEFRDFVSKVIFSSSGALAGILGTAAVTVDVHGLPVEGDGKDGRGTEIELSGLPFRGAVRVGKKGL